MCCQTANNRLDAGNSELASHIFGGNITGIMLCSTLCRLQIPIYTAGHGTGLSGACAPEVL